MQDTVNDRIRYIAEKMYSGNITAMAKSTLISRTTINSIIGEKEAYPGYEVIRRIAETSSINISLDWLITGKGSMLKSEAPSTEISNIQEEGTPLLPVEAWGGSLSGSSIAVLAEQCKKYNVPISNIDYLIPIAGDSMMPSYCPGDVVGIKKVNERAFIEWGKVYVLDTCNGVVIKEVQPSENEGCVICISHNLPERYKPFEISLCPEDFYGMYAVKGTVRIP